MSEASLSTCSQCGSPIATEDLSGGLAVRVDGELVCENCVDTLPGEAVVRINRMRALKGLEVTTYLVPHRSAPKLQLYSFTTSANISNHRRKLVADGFFDAPTLPPPGQRVEIPAEPKRVSSDGVAPGLKPQAKLMWLAAGVTGVILVIIVFILASLRNTDKKQQQLAETNNPPLDIKPPAPEKTRFDYPVDPQEAWLLSSQDRDCPNLVRQTIAQELIRQRSRQLDTAETALGERRIEEATTLARGPALPDDITFRALREREIDLQKRIVASQSLAIVTPPPPPRPEPIAQPPTPTTTTTTPTPPTPEPTQPVTQPTDPTNPAPNPTTQPTTPVTEPPPLPTPPTPENTPPSLPENRTPPQIPDQPITPEKDPGIITVWRGDFVTTGRDRKPYEMAFDGSEHIPDAWPGGISELTRSTRVRTLGRHGLFLNLNKVSLKNGGICLLLHPLRPDRKTLSIVMTNSKGKTIKFPPVNFEDNEWTTVVLPLPADASFDAAEIVTLSLTDDDAAAAIPEDSGFFLGKLVLVSGRPPKSDDAGLRPSALVKDDDRSRNLSRALDIIARNRKRSTYKKLIEIDRIRTVVTGPWSTNSQMRTDLTNLVKTVSNHEAPQTAFVPGTLTDSWLDTMAKGRNAPLDPAQTHLALWWTGGSEIQQWPDADKAVNDFWKRRINQMLDAGILPIVVLGPNTQSNMNRLTAEAMWEKFSAISPVRLYSLPVIDLRALVTAPDGSMDDSTRELAITLIGDAIKELNYLLYRYGAVK